MELFLKEMPYILILSLIIIVLFVLIIRRFVYIRRGRKFYPEYNSMAQVERINKEIAGSGFEFEPEQEIFISKHNAWQRKFGYRNLYDEMAESFGMIIDSEPVKFDYGGKKWLIEFWKGQYGITTGAEIGVYTSKDGRHYDSAREDEELFMSFILIKNRDVLIRRHDTHWWLTGFMLGEYSKPAELTMIAEIVFPDGQMCIQFINALRELGYNRKNMSVFRNTVRIRFEKPFTRQPDSKKSIRSRFKMKINKKNCKIFRRYTRRYKYTLDKIGYIKYRAPRLYEICVQTLGIWKKING